MIASGMLSQNCHCHDSSLTSMAPYIGPHTQPIVSIAPSVPRARAAPAFWVHVADHRQRDGHHRPAAERGEHTAEEEPSERGIEVVDSGMRIDPSMNSV